MNLRAAMIPGPKGILTTCAIRLSALLMLFVGSAPYIASAAQARRVAGAPAAALQPKDVFALRAAEDVQISPDGRRIAYVRAETDIQIDDRRRSVVILDVATGREEAIITGATNPRWSRRSDAIAYVGRDSGLQTQLFVAAADGSGRHQISDLPDGPASPSWSPDGGTIAFTMFVAESEPRARFMPPVAMPAGAHWAAQPRIITAVVHQRDGAKAVTPGHVQLFTVPANGGTVRQLTQGDADIDGAPAWLSNDALLFSSQRGDPLERSYMRARLYRVLATGGPLTAISPEGLGAREPSVSPDGALVAFVGTQAGTRDYEKGDLYVMGRDGKALRYLNLTVDREMAQPIWAPDGGSVFAAYGDQGIDVVGRFSLSGSSAVVAHKLGGGGSYSVGAGNLIAFATGSATAPPDVAVTAAGRNRRLTVLNHALLGARAVASVRPLPVRSTLDKSPVGAWITLPPNYDARRRYPLILDIHGGPYGYDTPVWNTSDQLYAAAGYVVLHANYRGSVSYGFAFADRIAKQFPRLAYDDLMSAVDAAVSAGVADPKRLFVMGGSAGGQLTAWIVGKTDRFRAAVAVKPIINAVSHSLTSDQYLAARYEYGAMPWEDINPYWSRSPLSLVGHVATPTLLLIGEDDHRTPLAEAEQFYNALIVRHVPTELVVMPDAGHESLTARPSRQLAGVALALDWFKRFDVPAAASADHL